MRKSSSGPAFWTPVLASKLLSAGVLVFCYLLARFGDLPAAGAAGVLTVITIPLHLAAWNNRVSRW